MRKGMRKQCLFLGFTLVEVTWPLERCAASAALIAKSLLGRGSLLSTYDKRKRDGIELKSVSLEMGRTSQSVEGEMGAFQEQLHSELEKDNFPRNHDYDGALKGLIVIHNTYRFDIQKASMGSFEFVDWLSGGLVRSYPMSEQLGPSDWLALAKRAITGFKFYDTAVDFVRQGLTARPLDKMALRTVAKFKALARSLANFNNEMLTNSGQMVGSNYSVTETLLTQDLNLDTTPIDYKPLNERSKNVRNALFRKVCQLGSFQSASKLNIKIESCKLLHHNDPYLKLGPFKVEVVRQKPYLSVFRDILTEKEMQFLIDYASPRLSRSRYKEHEANGKNGYNQIIHKTVQAWIQEVTFKQGPDLHPPLKKVDYPILHKLSKKVALATGLVTHFASSVTKYQVTNYGLGGTCETHIDPYGYLEGFKLTDVNSHLIETGDIFGTFMAWLKDVKAGGATGFVYPTHEIAVTPERGSAAFWLSLDRRGHREKLSDHGGCPIAIGSKWILNKWIYLFDNFEKFKCGLSATKESHRPPGQYYRN